MSGQDLTVWGIGTPRTMRVHWMLLEFGLDYESRPIGPRTGETTSEEFLALNPRHKIPVLQHGELTLCESAAIINYIGDTFEAPEGFFVPVNDARRAKLNEWCYFVMTELDALSIYVMRKHEDLAEIYGEAPNAVRAARETFRDQTSALFKDFDDGYLMPEGFSIADILLATCLHSALPRGVNVPVCLVDYMERINQRPAYTAAMKRNFPNET
jgi:glutathione S-transferase